MIQLLLPYIIMGKTIAFTIQAFVSKVMCLLFNMLSRFVQVYFPSKQQASFNFMAAVTIFSDFGAEKKNLSLFPLIPHVFDIK